MNFTQNFLNKEINFIKDAFINVTKYSSEEIIITDEKFNIVFQNLKYIQSDSKLNFLEMYKSFINENFKKNIKNFKTSDKNHMCIKMIFNDKNEINNLPVNIHICKIKNRKGNINGYTIIIQDITQEIENRIQKETFIDILSHDLRNPLRANIQILELILNKKFGDLGNSLQTILDELLSSCRFMNYMAENLIIKYKNEFNLYELNKQQYSLVKLIKEKCNSMINMLDKKHQTIEFIVKGCINEINMDVEEIGKVVNNLIVNASEHSSENSKIIIQIENNKENINVSFIDFGIMKTMKNPNDIFEKFMTCSNRFRKIGFGLEFYNCKKIIEAHNGQISAKNIKNKGTSITFSLPL